MHFFTLLTTALSLSLGLVASAAPAYPRDTTIKPSTTNPGGITSQHGGEGFADGFLAGYCSILDLIRVAIFADGHASENLPVDLPLSKLQGLLIGQGSLANKLSCAGVAGGQVVTTRAAPSTPVDSLKPYVDDLATSIKDLKVAIAKPGVSIEALKPLIDAVNTKIALAFDNLRDVLSTNTPVKVDVVVDLLSLIIKDIVGVLGALLGLDHTIVANVLADVRGLVLLIEGDVQGLDKLVSGILAALQPLLAKLPTV